MPPTKKTRAKKLTVRKSPKRSREVLGDFVDHPRPRIVNLRPLNLVLTEFVDHSSPRIVCLRPARIVLTDFAEHSSPRIIELGVQT